MLLVALICNASIFLTANAEELSKYYEVSADAKINTALNLLKATEGQWAFKAILGDNKTHRPVKIMFRDLAKISHTYRNYEALAAHGDDGTMYILISTKHQAAPAAAIASILCHEIIHQDAFSSIEEEVQGWTNEAKMWIALRNLNPALKDINPSECKLVDRLNTLAKLYEQAGNTSDEIRMVVITNSGYKALAMNSPEF